ncbi:hypothetical protein [Mesorhizobium sp.]|uniref:hypothetical protein n=1 Tax=Mesorhizobium sp. TaxID=1871066 RepID=UPI00257B8967|nr:hypothetical protein [Mesorhizobium sp.]
MTALETLEALGFANSAIVATKGAVQTFRIRTTRGWAYEKFTDEASVRAWAHNREAA